LLRRRKESSFSHAGNVPFAKILSLAFFDPLYWFSMKRGLLLFRSNPATIIIISTDPVVEETPRAARKFSPFKELNVINATIAIIDSGFASVHRRVMDIRLIIMLLLVKSFNERNVLPTCNLETFALFRIVDFWLIRTYINFTVKQFSENGKCLIAQGIFCSFVQRFCYCRTHRKRKVHSSNAYADLSTYPPFPFHGLFLAINSHLLHEECATCDRTFLLL